MLVRNRNFLNKVIQSEGSRSVKGQVWSRRSRQFSKHDTTTLGDIQIRAKFYCPIKNEYFLDRHRPSFQAVLDYYRTGLLRRPDEIPLDVMINELKFYRLDEIAIEDFLKSECILKSGFHRNPVRMIRRGHPVWASWKIESCKAKFFTVQRGSENTSGNNREIRIRSLQR